MSSSTPLEVEFKGPSSERPNIGIGPQLRQLRELTGVSQSKLARNIGVHQSALSRIEQQDDLLISTLMAYVRGLGAGLEIIAHLNETILGRTATKIRRSKPSQGDNLSEATPSRRDVVFSIKPQFSERILEGTKTVELRRRFPTSVERGAVALIYPFPFVAA